MHTFLALLHSIRHLFLMLPFSLLSKLFHVRPVTQTDVYRADPKEIPRIFQVTCLFCPLRNILACFDVNHIKPFFLPSVCRYYMLMRGRAKKRNLLWKPYQQLKGRRISHIKVTSSCSHFTTSPPAVKHVQDLCGTSSNHHQLWSAGAAESNAIKTT